MNVKFVMNDSSSSDSDASKVSSFENTKKSNKKQSDLSSISVVV